MIEKQKLIKENDIFEVISDGDIETRPVHLRELCHIKYFIDKQDNQIDAKNQKVNKLIQDI